VANQSILIIRHAEKPEPGADAGVDSTGQADSKSLTPRGWQRAGAWVQLFSPALGQSGALSRPTAIFASAPMKPHEKDDGGSKSRRPLQTVSPLAARLKVTVDLNFSKGQEAALAGAISLIQGVVLVCWQHEDILGIANALVPAPVGLPVMLDGDPDSPL